MIGPARRIFCGLALGVALFAMALPAQANQLDDIIAKKKIVIGVATDFPPFGSVGADLKPEGYDIDVAVMLAKDLGVELELVPVTLPNRVPYLQTNKADLIISVLGANPERAKVIAFSQPYAPFFSGVFAPKSMNIKTFDDLKGKRVGVTKGALEDLEISKRAPGIEMKRYEDNGTTIAAYLSGQVDVLVSGNTLAAKITKELPDKGLETKIVLKNSPAFIGLRKGEQELLNWLNIFILYHKVGGELNDLSVKWFGQPLAELPVY